MSQSTVQGQIAESETTNVLSQAEGLAERIGCPDAHPLDVLGAIRQVERAAEVARIATVAHLRDTGDYSWLVIGQKLGMTAQGAQQQYGRSQR